MSADTSTPEPAPQRDPLDAAPAAPSAGRAPVDELYRHAYAELVRLAARVRRDDANAALSTRTLVHEAWLKFARTRAIQFEDERHLKRIVIGAMQEVLVDAARYRHAAKRDGVTVALDETIPLPRESAERILAVHDALARLEALDREQAEVVRLRFFGGLTFDEIGAMLGMSPRTALRRWESARALLQVWLEEP